MQLAKTRCHVILLYHAKSLVSFIDGDNKHRHWSEGRQSLMGHCRQRVCHTWVTAGHGQPVADEGPSLYQAEALISLVNCDNKHLMELVQMWGVVGTVRARMVTA